MTGRTTNGRSDALDPGPAIPANHIPIAQELIYHTLVLPACRRQFSRIWLKLEGPPPHPADGPLIVYLNHTSWWDAYMLFLIYYRLLSRDFQNFILMEEKQLRPYRFFSWCGAFSIDRKRPGETERSVAYISQKLRQRRSRILWMFPQGNIVPNDLRPLVIYPGIARIIQQVDQATLWPIGLRYEFRGVQAPEAFISAGPYHAVNGAGNEQTLVEEITQRLTTTLDHLRDDVMHDRLDGYQTLIRGRRGIDQTFDRLLALLPRRDPAGR